MLEASTEKIVAHGVGARVHPEERAVMAERVRRRLAGLELPERCQVRLELAGKPVKWPELGDTMVAMGRWAGFAGIFLDVTQRHEAELDTRGAVERQRELNDLRSRFVAMTSPGRRLVR